MQMSGHIHNLNASSPGKELFLPMWNRVKPRASLDGTEKRKISTFARIRTHYPWLGLRQYFKQIALPASIGEEENWKDCPTFVITPEYQYISFHNKNTVFIVCVCVCARACQFLTLFTYNICFEMYVKNA